MRQTCTLTSCLTNIRYPAPLGTHACVEGATNALVLEPPPAASLARETRRPFQWHFKDAHCASCVSVLEHAHHYLSHPLSRSPFMRLLLRLCCSSPFHRVARRRILSRASSSRGCALLLQRFRCLETGTGGENTGRRTEIV